MKYLLIVFAVVLSCTVAAQKELPPVEPVIDSTAFMDSVFREMDEILDAMAASKSFLSVSAGAGTGFFNFKSNSSTTSNPEKKILFSPGVNYLHKTGFGLSATGCAIFEESKFNLYQLALTPSYDYSKRGLFSAGIAFTHYFTKEDLSFYTTPISNEVYGYFNYKKPWLKPGVAIAYGWGSKTSYEEKQLEIGRMRRLRNPRLVTVRTDESVMDLSLLFSVRHDFTWQRVLNDKGLFMITPIIILSSGTQNFGFNTSLQGRSKVANNFLPNNQYISDSRAFDFNSTTFVVRADYSLGKMFVQAQTLLDYYLHSAENRFNNAFALIAGLNF